MPIFLKMKKISIYMQIFVRSLISALCQHPPCKTQEELGCLGVVFSYAHSTAKHRQVCTVQRFNWPHSKPLTNKFLSNLHNVGKSFIFLNWNEFFIAPPEKRVPRRRAKKQPSKIIYIQIANQFNMSIKSFHLFCASINVYGKHFQ